MTQLAASSTQTKYPLRYWLMVACAVGIPNFVKFDSSNLTHNAGLFNLSSIEAILLSLTLAFSLLSMRLLNGKPVLVRSVRFDAPVWLALLATMVCATVLGPPSHLNPGSHTGLLVSGYRLFEWITAFLLLLSLYSREPEASATDFIIRTMGRVCWINILLVWCILPILPSQAYGDPMDGAEATRRLGGLLVHPIGLGLYAEIAFFYSLLFMRGWRQWGGCSWALLTLVLTYARAEEGAFVLTLFLYLLLLSRRVTLQAAGAGLLVCGALGAAVFHNRVIEYAGRGHGVSNITTLSERTYVWQAAMRALVLRPWTGYGFVEGPKNALREQWTFAHWIPPHCHNELLQSAVSGGICAALLVLTLYLLTIIRAARQARRGARGAFLFVVAIQLTILSLGEPILTNPISRSGAVFLLMFFGVAGQARAGRRIRSAPVLDLPTHADLESALAHA